MNSFGLPRVVLFIGLSSLAQGQSTTPAAPLSTDTPKLTKTAQVTLPSGWLVTQTPAVLQAQAPEGDLNVAIVEETTPEAEKAVAQAWTAVDPGFSRKVKAVYPEADLHGWSRQQLFDYETSPNERTVIQAEARYAADHWTVVLTRGAEQTAEKRSGQIGLILSTLQPKGYQRESFAGRTPLPLTPERIEELRSFLESSMKRLEVPGVGFALIEGGKVVYEGGVGVKAMGRPEPVDANTLFMAASNTKGMTTLLMAKLVDAKKLTWDEPVVKAYPNFALGSAEVTRSVEMHHLVCACTGLPRQDYEWTFNYKKFSPASTFTLLSAEQPTSKFGEVFQYNNLMASAAGYIAGQEYFPQMELGPAYDRAMEEQIFRPLGMRETTFDMAKAQGGNFASPHSDDVDGHTKPISMAQNYSIVPFRPAGGVWTSVHEMSKYLMLELAEGKLPDGTQLVSRENLLERRKPQIALTDTASYGMGLALYRPWGILRVGHDGGMFGYRSEWMILPESGVGAILFTNSDTGAMLLNPFLRKVAEVVFNGHPEANGRIDAQVASYREGIAKERAKLTLPADPAQTKDLAERYTNTALGEIRVKHSGQDTIFALDSGDYRVASRKNDDGTVSLVIADAPLADTDYLKTVRDGKRALIIRDGQHEYVYFEAGQPK